MSGGQPAIPCAKTALVVDDEAPIRLLVRSVLSRMGFRVEEAPDGQHALTLLKRNGLCADLLVTDIQMPGADGVTVAQAFMTECPSTRVILMSGYSDAGSINMESNGRWWFISKPFSQQILFDAIQRIGIFWAPGEPAACRKVILVVDDDPLVRNFVQTVLSNNGYATLSAADGEEGLELARRYPGRIDLVISDVRMPRMTGPELADHIKKARSGCRVLLMSGYASGVLRECVRDQDFIRKPFLPADLKAKVEELLISEPQKRPEEY